MGFAPHAERNCRCVDEGGNGERCEEKKTSNFGFDGMTGGFERFISDMGGRM